MPRRLVSIISRSGTCSNHGAVKNGLNPLDARLPLLTQFLEYLFTVRKVGLRTIKNYRSAIAHYWKSSVGYDIPDADSVSKDLFRGFARDKPMPMKLGPIGTFVWSFVCLAVFDVQEVQELGPSVGQVAGGASYRKEKSVAWADAKCALGEW